MAPSIPKQKIKSSKKTAESFSSNSDPVIDDKPEETEPGITIPEQKTKRSKKPSSSLQTADTKSSDDNAITIKKENSPTNRKVKRTKKVSKPIPLEEPTGDESRTRKQSLSTTPSASKKQAVKTKEPTPLPLVRSLDAESTPMEAVNSPSYNALPLFGSHTARRYISWAAIAIALLLISIPIGLWMYYQSGHVMSRNAMVRGNLAELGTRLSGVLAHVEVTEGNSVVAGQILARLEDRHIRSEAQEAQAELEGLEQELAVEQLAILHEQRSLDNKLKKASANQKAAKAEVAAAKSRADNARQSHKMRKELLGRNAISRDVVREADAKRRTEQALLTVAKANYTAAQSVEAAARLESEGLAIRKQRIGVLKANVLRAKARLEGANADLESTLIRAPSDGAIVRWLVHLGGSVKVGVPVVSMWLGNNVWIEAWIDEDEIAGVKVGSKAKVTLQSFPGREFSGVIEKLGITTDFQLPASVDIMPQPRFARLRGAPVVGVLLRLHNPPEGLLPGLSANVAIHNSES